MEGGGTILFLMRNLYYLRNFEAPLRVLADRGFRVAVLFDPSKDLPDEVVAQANALARDFPGQVTFEHSHRRRDIRRHLASEIRCARDILRYHHPRFANAHALKTRAGLRALPPLRMLFRGARYADPHRNAEADKWLAALDAKLPIDRAIRERIAAIKPDLLVVTPLIDLRTAQIDWVRAAQHLGIPTVLAVASWDNLTNKSRIQAMPDRVIVWNDIQRREAIELHDAPEDRIVVTGAQLYDHWFEREPSCDRAVYCGKLGFDPGRPIVLYVGSSQSIAPSEHLFVRRWLAALRSSPHEALRSANVLIRPHPMNQEIYRDLRIEDLGPAAVHPRTGGFPVTDDAKADYFDALYHCAALVGLNTSALIEASILGKRCFTVLDPQNVSGQEGTLHFHYLTQSGIVRQAHSLEDHMRALATEIEGAGGGADLTDFVRGFLRPHGIEAPATPHFVAAIEQAAAVCPQTQSPPAISVPERLMLDAASVLVLAASVVWSAPYVVRSRLRRLSPWHDDAANRLRIPIHGEEAAPAPAVAGPVSRGVN